MGCTSTRSTRRSPARQVAAAGPVVLVEQLELQSVEEALGHAVVVGVADGAHGAQQAGGPQAGAERPARVLRAVVGVGDAAVLRRLTPPDRHLHCIDDQLGADVVGDRPAHHSAAPGVEDDAEVHPAFVGAVFGDVHHPQPVRTGDVELALDQILRRGGAGVAAGATPSLAPVDALHAGLAHEPLDSLAGAADALAEAEVGMHPGRAVGATGAPVDVDDGVGQVGVGQVTIAHRPRPPRA